MESLTRYLAQQREFIDTALESYLPMGGNSHGEIQKCMRYSVEGGKRLRPILVVIAARLFGSEVQRAIPTACAVELIHSHSLILDDLPCMDDDDFRRGRPASHTLFGESVALLAADALLNMAIAILGRNHRDAGMEPETALEIIREVGEAVGVSGLIGAQMTDLFEPADKLQPHGIEQLHFGKTASLFRLAVRAGAYVGGACSEHISALTRYAESFGLAFQLMDDVLDATADGHAFSGEGMNRVNYALTCGLDKARERVADLTRQAVQALSCFGAEAEPFRQLAAYNASRSE